MGDTTVLVQKVIISLDTTSTMQAFSSFLRSPCILYSFCRQLTIYQSDKWCNGLSDFFTLILVTWILAQLVPKAVGLHRLMISFTFQASAFSIVYYYLEDRLLVRLFFFFVFKLLCSDFLVVISTLHGFQSKLL